MSSGEMPRALAARALISSAISMPFALQVLALPLLQITAWATPLARCFFVTVRGAPLTRLVVYTAAALPGTLLKIRDKSFLVWFFRMPQWTPFAEKPFAAQTPPSITFILLSFSHRDSPVASSSPSSRFMF